MRTPRQNTNRPATPSTSTGQVVVFSKKDWKDYARAGEDLTTF
ncbi:hypothetical protein [Mucilaginibacter psychrotolerans]|nr:hypothetical protein [Mucilaginibacter psychrotolerans]